MNTAASQPPPSLHAVVALCVLNHIALSGARVAVALHALRLGVPSVGLGLMLAPFALASVLGALPLGRCVDRIGARIPALAGMTLTTVALALAAWQSTLVVLALTAAAVGFGYAASLVALQSELARGRSDASRAAGFARFAVGTAASGGFGPFLVGQCMAHAGPRAAFGALALASLAAGWVGAWQARRLLSLRASAIVPRPALFSRATLSGLGGLRRLMFADLLMALAWNANGVVVPLLGQRHGWSADTVGNLLGAFGVAVMLVRLLPSAWRTRGGDWPTVARALVASGLSLALLPVVTALSACYVLEALLGAGLGSSLPSLLALIEARTPLGRRAEVLGLRQSVLGLSAATLPAALGALVAAAGLASALIGFGGSLLGAATVIVPRVGSRASASAGLSRSEAGARSRDGA